MPSPPTREPSDDDELGATAIRLGCLVGTLVRAHSRPSVSTDVLSTALIHLFGETGLDRVGLTHLVVSAIRMAQTFGLIELTPKGWVSTS